LQYLEPGSNVHPDSQINVQPPEAFIQICKALLKWPFFDKTIIYQEAGGISMGDREVTHQWTSALEDSGEEGFAIDAIKDVFTSEE
jgi:hypothetical protein